MKCISRFGLLSPHRHHLSSRSSEATSSISDHSSNQALPYSASVALSSCPVPEFLLLQPNVTCDSTDVAALRLLLSNFNETSLQVTWTRPDPLFTATSTYQSQVRRAAATAVLVAAPIAASPPPSVIP
ncbi:hypothetical protein NL676_029090 [Syzygium grande]|nr:hypothetical protein NL676_029090 [Syzygium grande]